MHVTNVPWLNHWLYLTGFWRTDQIVTLGLFHFIGPADDYFCTLHIHSAITRLDWLVCFSRATFADPVNSQLRQWDQWKTRYGSEIHPSDREMSLMPSKHVWAYGWHFWDSWLVQTVLTESLTRLHLPTLLLHLSHLLLPLTPYNVPSLVLWWFEKSNSKSSSVS